MNVLYEGRIKDIPDIIKGEKKFRVAELFAGTGAFSLAFENTGKTRTVFANDFVDSSKKLFDSLKYKCALTLRDIHDLDTKDIPPFDILTTGFPCQPFSLAGNKKGFEDERANVFWKMLKIIEEKRPSCLLLENVKNILTHDDGKTFSIIKNSITNLGYTFYYRILNTSEITGIPQNRERTYICFLDKFKAQSFKWPEPVTNIIPFEKMLESTVPDKYYYNETDAIWNKLKEGVVKNNTVYQYRRFYIRENKKGVCPTLTANMGTGGHNVPIIKDSKGIRKLTPSECFRLQGFDEKYISLILNSSNLSDSALYKLVGNAVSIGVVQKLARSVIECLELVVHKAEVPELIYTQESLSKLLKQNLKDICRKIGLKRWSALNKSQLIELILYNTN